MDIPTDASPDQQEQPQQLHLHEIANTGTQPVSSPPTVPFAPDRSSEDAPDDPVFYIQEDEPGDAFDLLATPFQLSGAMTPAQDPTSKMPSPGDLPPIPPSSMKSEKRSRPFPVLRVLILVAVIILVVLTGIMTVFGQYSTPTSPAPAPSVGPTHSAQVMPTRQPTPSSPAMTPKPTPINNPLQDTFHRPKDLLGSWGTATGGTAWQIIQKPNAFSVVANVGHIQGSGQEAAYYTAILGPEVVASRSVEVFSTFAMTFNKEQQTNMGVIVHWRDSTTYDKAYLDGTQLIILENRGGQQTTLTKLAFVAHSGLAYTLRLQASGATLQAKAWSQNAPEPAAWMLSTSGTLTAGQAGVRARLLPASQVQLTAFQITTAD